LPSRGGNPPERKNARRAPARAARRHTRLRGDHQLASGPAARPAVLHPGPGLIDDCDEADEEDTFWCP